MSLYLTDLGEYTITSESGALTFDSDSLTGPAGGMDIANLHVRRSGGAGECTVKAMYPYFGVSGVVWILEFNYVSGSSNWIVSVLITDEMGSL